MGQYSTSKEIASSKGCERKVSTGKFYYCTEDGKKLIKYQDSDEYFCEKCLSIFKLIDNTQTIRVDDLEITTGDITLIKIN
jgi:Zn finger protein HypA/HybF involved in hydrogenase expression